ncbi:hypothetical protein COO60DRAFT_1628327 [Scenedesmus sp. NREL 46B-D3]|nr:hypothetical protein COO60DRAFT_1628327 [Scenedesmus sp. NREL 46B-D3]
MASLSARPLQAFKALGVSASRSRTALLVVARKSAAKTSTAYICVDCGYIYDGKEAFDKLPNSYRCPVCNAPKRRFRPTEAKSRNNDAKAMRSRMGAMARGEDDGKFDDLSQWSVQAELDIVAHLSTAAAAGSLSALERCSGCIVRAVEHVKALQQHRASEFLVALFSSTPRCPQLLVRQLCSTVGQALQQLAQLLQQSNKFGQLPESLNEQLLDGIHGVCLLLGGVYLHAELLPQAVQAGPVQQVVAKYVHETGLLQGMAAACSAVAQLPTHPPQQQPQASGAAAKLWSPFPAACLLDVWWQQQQHAPCDIALVSESAPCAKYRHPCQRPLRRDCGPSSAAGCIGCELQQLLCLQLACLTPQLQRGSSKHRQRQQQQPESRSPAEQLLEALGEPAGVDWSAIRKLTETQNNVIVLLCGLALNLGVLDACLKATDAIVRTCRCITAECDAVAAAAAGAAGDRLLAAESLLTTAARACTDALESMVQPLLHELGPAVLTAVRKHDLGWSLAEFAQCVPPDRDPEQVADGMADSTLGSYGALVLHVLTQEHQAAHLARCSALAAAVQQDPTASYRAIEAGLRPIGGLSPMGGATAASGFAARLPLTGWLRVAAGGGQGQQVQQLQGGQVLQQGVPGHRLAEAQGGLQAAEQPQQADVAVGALSSCWLHVGNLQVCPV